MYEYRAKLNRVVDGDTVDLIIDLGFNVSLKERFRLLGINAPEVRGPEKVRGKEATAALQKLIEDTPELIVRTEKDSKGKYGRWLCWLISRDGISEVNLNLQLVEMGFAEEVEY